MWIRVSSGHLALSLVLATVACGGGGSSSTPTSPTAGGGGTTTGASDTVSITVTSGAQSFSPNPLNRTQNSGVAWRNGDSTVHRIVANDGSFDTGDISPGSTSAVLPQSAAGTNYHCSIHPAMVGSIGSAQGQPPPECTGPYCG
jgi:plastocyanin